MTTNFHQVVTLVVLAAAIVLFLSERGSPALVSMLTILTLGIAGVLTQHEVFWGFSQPVIFTIIAVLIMTKALERTAVTDKLGEWILRVGGRSEKRLLTAVMLGGAAMSFFMNNIAALAVLMPSVITVSRKANISQRRVLMPLAFATLLGGVCTLLTTTNLVASAVLRQYNLPDFGLLTFLPVGVPMMLAGTIFMVFWGRRLLPAQSAREDQSKPRPAAAGDLAQVYYLGEYLFRVRVGASSRLVGQTLAELRFRERYHVTVAAIEHNGTIRHSPTSQTRLTGGDVLVLVGEMEEFVFCDPEPDMELLPLADWREWEHQKLEAYGILMAEAVLSPRSRLVGTTLRRSHFGEKFGMTVLSILRGGRRIYAGLADLPLEFGDALLLQGPREQLTVLRDDPDLILLTRGEEVPVKVPAKGRLSMVIFVGALTAAMCNVLPIAEALLLGAMIMVITGILRMEEAFEAVEWRVVFLVAGMLTLGFAMIKTGAAAVVGHQLVHVLGPLGPEAVLIGLMLLTLAFSQALKGSAVCAVLVPVAIETGREMGLNPRSLAMGVALASSMAFLTPFGHPVNLLVQGQGHYRIRDYFRVGLPLVIVCMVVTLLVMRVFWPLQ